ncbi:hypothetical protein GCM10009547_28780 [Sporichthya brevicatena]|uniref:Luciferase-like domain-containing protein n=1 Tax=Sporichthya brevicatena TaxID=171442 RepID=A0ABN1GYW2_9ACTN
MRNSGPDSLQMVQRLPAAAEDWGYSSVWFTDHSVWSRGMAELPYHGALWDDVLSCLAFCAATTRTITIGPGVLVLALRDPVLTARALTTVDRLSGGRLAVGIGVGYLQDEYAVVGRGALFKDRGAATDEAIDLIKRCWTGGEFSWPGAHYGFDAPITFEPTPVQRPHPPLYVGGHSPAALRRAARHADAWYPAVIEPAEVVRLGAELDQRAGRRIPRVVRLVVPPDIDVAARVAEYEDAGCDEVVVEFLTDSFDQTWDLAGQLAADRLTGSVV